MEKRSNNETIEMFIEDLKSILQKIEKNSANAKDYFLFQEMMQLIGIPADEMMTKELAQNGFNNWDEFYVVRKLPIEKKERELIAINAILGAINGMSKAALEYLETQKEYVEK